MIKMIVVALTALVTISTSAQQNPPTERKLEPQDYLQKSRKQKKTANVLLIAGAGLIITGALIPKGDLVESNGLCPGGGIFCNEKYENDGIKDGLMITGAASALASIPFYTSANKNRRRAGVVGIRIQGAKYAFDRSLMHRSLAMLRVEVNL